MKQFYNNICGPFVFLNHIDKFKIIYKEMCQEYPIFRKMFENKEKRIEIIVTNSDEYNAQYNPETQTIFISKDIVDDKKMVKRCLAHEYTHFIQDLNIRKNFPGLNLRSLLMYNNIRDFAFYIFLELDAYLKSDAIILYNLNICNTAQSFLNIFRLYSRKFTDFGYAEHFNFIDMGDSINNQKEFIKISECLLNTFTDKNAGGKIFPPYILDWDEMLKQLYISYIENRNFDVITEITGYSNKELIDLFYNKISKILDEYGYKDMEFNGILYKRFLKETDLIDKFLLEYHEDDDYQSKHPYYHDIYYDRIKIALDVEILANIKEKQYE